MLPKICLFIVLCAWSAVLEAVQIPESCDQISLYREMGCTPIFEKDIKCPVEYNCDNFMKFSPKQCYYNGKAYAKGEELKEEEKAEACQFHCKCTNAYPKQGNAAWTCAAGECFGDTYKPGCVNLYTTLKSCCRNSTYCEKTDPKPSHTCSYQGKTYVERQIIYDNAKCKKCICDANFKDTLEGPSCQDQSCGVLLHSTTTLRDGCVPVYYGGAHCSCPIEHKCPESTDAIAEDSKELGATAKSGRKCKFGDLTLKVGDKLVKKGTELFECGCETPPFITCVQKPHKETAETSKS